VLYLPLKEKFWGEKRKKQRSDRIAKDKKLQITKIKRGEKRGEHDNKAHLLNRETTCRKARRVEEVKPF